MKYLTFQADLSISKFLTFLIFEASFCLQMSLKVFYAPWIKLIRCFKCKLETKTWRAWQILFSSCHFKTFKIFHIGKRDFSTANFFSKVSEIFNWSYCIHFFTQTCLNTYIRLIKNLKGLWQNLRKIFGKSIPTPDRDMVEDLQVYIASLACVCVSFL